MSFMPGMMPGWDRDAAAFHPSQLFPAAGGWWDSSDTSTLFQLSGGTTAVAADADPVGYWGDKSGNANHVIQATSGQRPLYRTNFGLEFDGSDDQLKCANLSATMANTTLWVIAMFKYTSTVSQIYGRIISGSIDGSTFDANSVTRAAIIYYENGVGLGAARGGAKSYTSMPSGSTKYIVESKFDGTNHTATLNGTAASAVGSTGSFAIDALAFGREMSGSGNGAARINLGEVIVLDYVPTAQQILDCREYLRVKWSVY